MRKYFRIITACIAATAMTMASVVTTSATSWKQDGKGWWFENTDGTYVSNAWKQVNGKWYAFDNQGYMRTGWFQENGKWYYLDNSGAMRTGWVKENEKWYYLDRSGAMQTGWIKENGKWYYLAADGVCFINTRTPDGYMVDANGAWIDSSFFLDNYDRYEDSDEDEDSDTYEEPTASQEEESTTDKEEPTTSQEESTTDREEPTTSQEEESTTDKEEPTTSQEESTTDGEEPTTSQEEESTTDREEPTTSQEEESTTDSEEPITNRIVFRSCGVPVDENGERKPSLEEVVKAYKDFNWDCTDKYYEKEYCGYDSHFDNYLIIDLNNDGIPECIRRHCRDLNEANMTIGILTYSEGIVDYDGIDSRSNHNCNMMFWTLLPSLYYGEDENIFCFGELNDPEPQYFLKINDKGGFEMFQAGKYVTDGITHYWIFNNGREEISEKEYYDIIDSFGEFTDISLKYEDTYRSIDAAYEAYLSETGENENTEEDVLSESKVYEAIMNMQSEYPEGMEWTNDNSYSWNGGIYSGGQGCAGFAFLLSDAAFGDLPARKYTQYDPSTIKVGDIIRINNDSHSVIVLTVDEEGVTVAEGNYNRSIHWGRSITHEQLMDADYIITRYQES